MDKRVKDQPLPFKIGQLAESRSFLQGFRSAWFRCKIKEITCRKGIMEYALEFYDFPDEKIKWTRSYQIPPVGNKKTRKITKMLMMRPQYPPICYESEVAHANKISEVIVVINGVWRVGDLVDSLFDGCYWSGRVTQILGDDKVQIEFPPPPIGEGSLYEALCKDLRPSLEWSPEHGWSILTSQEGEDNYNPRARLITTLDQVGLPTVGVDVVIKNVEATDGLTQPDASFSCPVLANASTSTDKSEHSIGKEPAGQPLSIAISNEETHRSKSNTDMEDGPTGLSHTNGNVEEAENSSGEEDRYYSNVSAKKIRIGGGSITLNSMRFDTIEAPTMDLEELVNKVKWLKSILESGVPLPNAVRPPWKFVQHHGSSSFTPE